MNNISIFHNGIKAASVSPIKNEDHFLYTFPAITAENGKLEILLWEADCGDEGYFAVPYVNANFLTYFKNRPDADFTAAEGCLMPMAGFRRNGSAYLMIARGMIYDFRVRVSVIDGHYRLWLVYDLDSINIYEPISLAIYPLGDADYSDMARLYRRDMLARLNLTPLSQRNEPHIKYALEGMPIIRIRMGWKPVPSPIDEQTIETEPPMHVACTFADVENLVDEMKSQGIERAEICLVGWNVRGHDGRWPQAFPVEEAFGGEEGLKHLIAHTQAAGYRMVCHTNASDAYRIADCWDENTLIRKKNGDISMNDYGWSGGNMYHLCPVPSLEKYQRPMLDRVQELGFSGFHYIDVISVVAPRTCCHPDHPLTSQQYADAINATLACAKERMGGVSSEGSFDFCAKNLDFSLYAGFNVLDNKIPVADESVPLWQLVYHGYIFSNASAETVNHMVKPARNRLKAYEYGSIPAVYYYSRFVGGDRSNWMGDDDMLFDTPERLKHSVALLKAELDAYKSFAPRQLAFMDKHEKLSEGVYRVTYSDGWKCVFNYNETAASVSGCNIPAQSFVQIPPTEE